MPGWLFLSSIEKIISHVFFFLTPISRSTALTMEVQHLLCFINIKTDVEPVACSSKSKPKTAGKHPP